MSIAYFGNVIVFIDKMALGRPRAWRPRLVADILNPASFSSLVHIPQEQTHDHMNDTNKLWQSFILQRKHGNSVDTYTYARLLQSCTNTKSIEKGKMLHTNMLKLPESKLDAFAWNTLMNMYAKCSHLELARQVFDKMPHKNLISWTAIVGGYSQEGHFGEALKLFVDAVGCGIRPNQITICCVAKACAGLGSSQHALEVLCWVLKVGFNTEAQVGGAMVDALGKCGFIRDAIWAFHHILDPDLIAWSALITGCAQNRHEKDAVQFFCKMLLTGITPNNFTYASVLKACSDMQVLKTGQLLHAHILKTRWYFDVFVRAGLIELYANHGNLETAIQLFNETVKQDMVLWSAMIAKCAQNKHEKQALLFFLSMQRNGIKPNSSTLSSVVSACCSIENLELGRQVHVCGIKLGLDLEPVAGSALIHMYAKCKCINNARSIFNKIPENNAICWNAMIVGNIHLGHVVDAQKLFMEMRNSGIMPNEVTFSSILSSYASLAIAQQGRQFHAFISKSIFQNDVSVGNALIDMYAKSGCISDARQVFDGMAERNLITWNTMIVSYSRQGHGKEAIKIFESILQSGIQPNNVSFVGVLSACSHAGLVDDGIYYFDSMTKDYGIVPILEHYSCMVNLFGRPGLLQKAFDFVKRMPLKPGMAVWRSLLSACKTYHNLELAEYAAEKAFELEPEDVTNYVLLSNIYADAGMWEKVSGLRKLMDEKGLKKDAGLSWIEIDSKMHSFVAGDVSHPQKEEIYGKLDTLARQMREHGYSPNINIALMDVETEQKEQSISYHSEKLAVAFGLIKMPNNLPIRIIKNLRICGDCHAAIKLISKIASRKIIVRDMARFHHFENGHCSCGDFW